jgi:hypothetical protein
MRVLTDDKPTIILAYLKEKGYCRTAELVALIGLKPTQTKAYLYQLQQK